MTDDQRQRIEAAVREACQTIWINDFSTRWAKEHVIPKLDKPFLTAITPVIDAMLSEASNNAHLEKVYKVFEEVYEKRIAELEGLLRATREAVEACDYIGAYAIIDTALNGEPNDG